jgi:sugar/nucleoside kinase (ribokinase family)
MGFDTRQVQVTPGETVPLEILLEPNGERTILGPSNRSRTALSAEGPLVGDAAYLNVFLLDETLVGRLHDIPLVVSQLPLRPSTPRPVDYILTSRTDAPGDLETVWQRAAVTAGSRLKMLVLTDGPRRITLYDGARSVDFDPAPAVQGVSTIGAGDRFSGAFLFALLEGRDPASAATEASRSTADWLSQRQPV